MYFGKYQLFLVRILVEGACPIVVRKQYSVTREKKKAINMRWLAGEHV